MAITNKTFFSLAAIIIFVFFGFLLIKNDSPSNININQIHSVKIAGQIIKVELALTPETHERGLSGKDKLEKDEGMLFIFPRVDEHPFWMKDMNFPIDIIWIEGENFEDLRVVYVKKDATPSSYPATFSPDAPSKYVLEVNSGFSEKNNLKAGDKVEFLSS